MGPTPIWTDLKTFNAHRFRNRLFFLLAGYPCQPFSYAGRRRGSEDPRHLWPHCKETIRATNTPFVWLENVRGHITLGFEEVAQDLHDMGYGVEAGIFSAEEVGAPHRRERLFIFAYAHDPRWLQPKLARREDSTWPRGDGEAQPLADTESSRVRGLHQRSGQEREGTLDPDRRRPLLGSPKSVGLQRELSVRNQGPSSGRSPQQPEGTGHGTGGRWAIEPDVGRVVDGATYGMDRLRLCGNGVVPDQAELAMWTLIWKAIKSQEVMFA